MSTPTPEEATAAMELAEAINYLMQRKINLGRVMAVVNATRKHDAAIVRAHDGSGAWDIESHLWERQR
jgi:hypothetical protein